MRNKQLALVNFEQAERLDAVGFDWETRYRFDYNSVGSITETSTERNHNDRFKWTNKDKQGCSAPTVALALKWFRDVKHISGDVSMCGRGNEKWCNNTKDSSSQDYNTYEQAESALLDELLTLLETK